MTQGRRYDRGRGALSYLGGASRPPGLRGTGGFLRALVIVVVLILLLLLVAVVVIGVLLISNAEAVLAWLNGVLRQIQQLPFIGGGGGGGG